MTPFPEKRSRGLKRKEKGLLVFHFRTSLAFRLMPQSNAILDCSPITTAGHVIPHSYVPISVSQFMDDISAEEDALCNHNDSTYVSLFYSQLKLWYKKYALPS